MEFAEFWRQIIFSGMQSITPVPKRIVLRFLVEYELEERAILQAYFALFGPKPVEEFEDFFSHLIPANESPKMHIVLDLYCKSVPSVDIQAIEYQVFKVKKSDGLYAVFPLSSRPLKKRS
jgi:hypothetical protein